MEVEAIFEDPRPPRIRAGPGSSQRWTWISSVVRVASWASGVGRRASRVGVWTVDEPLAAVVALPLAIWPLDREGDLPGRPLRVDEVRWC